jgi:DNA-binding NarL/FixJ family response regulator
LRGRLQVQPAEAQPPFRVLERPQPSHRPRLEGERGDLVVRRVGRALDAAAHPLEAVVRMVDVGLLGCEVRVRHRSILRDTGTDEGIAEIAAGRAALARGEWAEASARFGAALARAETPEALAGLGVAARYQLDATTAIDAHERGYRLARAAGDDDTAALLAVQLAYDAYAFRGPAEAAGWVERAAMLVEGRPPSLAAAFVPLLRAHLSLALADDPDSAGRDAARALALARDLGATDVEVLALALRGLSEVTRGEIEQGMRRLDAAAAAAVGGEMTDADSIETVCCYVIDACRRVRDVERASEWCLRVRELATRYGDRQMFSVCRISYADVLLWQGDWQEAEEELGAAAAELAPLRPGREVDALVRLAELRRRQGRTSEAEELLAASEPHRLHALVAGLLALDRGDATAALDSATRFLRRIGDRDRLGRLQGLELVVRAGVAAAAPAAAEAAAEMETIAAVAPTAPIRAALRLAQARLARSNGELQTARAAFEDAIDLLDDAGAPYDAALARLELADVLRMLDRGQLAARVEARGRAALRALGAAEPEQRPGGLSRREAEVLRLVARGLSNGDIAAQLVLSVRTVEHHVAAAYAKIGASGRTARAVATAWAHAHGLG